MNRIKKYTPAFCTGVEPEEYNFNSYEEFEQTPIIKHNKKWFGDTFKDIFFVRFVVKPYRDIFLVQCYYKENGEEKSCVIGYLDNSNHIESILEL